MGKPLLVFQDRVPSVLNGGLSRISPLFWVAVLGTAFAIETHGILRANSAKKAEITNFVPGDLGFDPLNLSSSASREKKFKFLESELFNGRMAMLAITGFAAQEWWTQ